MNCYYNAEDLGDEVRLHMQLMTGRHEVKQYFVVNHKTEWAIRSVLLG